MKLTTVACLVGTAAAFPSLQEFKAAAAKRQYSGSGELLGDLVSLKDDKLTEVGKDIKSILLGKGDGQSDDAYAFPKLESKECKEDKCCVWKYINEELFEMMQSGGQCNDFARASIRMGFHDAAAWDKDSPYGGADGSLLLSDEMTRIENSAMAAHGDTVKGIFNKYKAYGIGMADLIQACAKVGVLSCPGGPRIRLFIGRKDDSKAAPTGKLPPPFFSADQSIDLFKAKTVSPAGLVALLGAHTASKNHNPGLGANLPQDKTPGKWDTEYFKETLQANASAGVIRFQADVNLAQSSKTSAVFKQFQAQKGSWDEAYAREYIRMSLMGVKTINQLTECSKAMPKGKVVTPPKSSTSSVKPSTTYKPTYSTSQMTSTYYESKTVTITSCPPEKTNCPYGPKNPLVTYTKVPVSSSVYYTSVEVKPTDYPAAPEYPATSAAKPVEPTKKPVVTGGAGRLSGGVFAAAAISFVALLL